MRVVCASCGLSEEAHCVFDPLEMPDECVCDSGSWIGCTDGKVTPICEEHQGEGEQYCHRCEHDRECHERRA